MMVRENIDRGSTDNSNVYWRFMMYKLSLSVHVTLTKTIFNKVDIFVILISVACYRSIPHAMVGYHY